MNVISTSIVKRPLLIPHFKNSLVNMLRTSLILAAFLVIGCDSTFDASRLDNDLAGSQWLFERAETDDGNVERNSDATRSASIEFGERVENSSDYEVTGYNGCNAFSGRYTVDGADIQFIQIAQTERACQPTEARIEEVFNRAISGARSFSVDGDNLLIDAPAESVKLRLVRDTSAGG